MKFAALVCLVVFLAADGDSIPVEQDSRREDLLTRCLVQILSKVLYKTEDNPVHPECKNILTPGSGHSTVVKNQEDAQEELKKPRGESKVKEEELIEDLLKPNKREDLDDERSQEEFPNFMKRKFKEKREEVDDERSQEEFPSFMKRRTKEKREEHDDERSQEEFPSFYKRGYKHKREDYDDERSQEEFPQKRHFSILYKRDNPDEERSQEEFPPYEYKRSHLLASREKREEPDYDRSQEDFPSYTHKRNYGDGEEEDEESEEREKRIWKPSHRYHHKKKHHKRSENEGFEEPDYDRSQEDFPSYTNKRNYGDGEEEDEESEEREKRIWKPSHRYHHKKKHHKRSENEGFEEPDYDRSQEEFPSYTNKRSYGNGRHQKQIKDLLNEQSEDMNSPEMRSEESEEVDEDIAKRYWKPTHRYHHKKHPHKRGDSIELENEDEPILEKTPSLHESIDKAIKLRSPEEEEKEIVHEVNENELKQGQEAALRYLTKKKNELEERLLNKGEVYEKRSPWINRGYYHPAWYKRSHKVGESTEHPNLKLEDVAETLRYKRGLPSQESSSGEEKDVSQQKLFTPKELTELEKLASVDQQMKDTT
ncbi:secretogranin-1 [Pimephales promelas]|uniref:secretogranin-1 n=1 Tax=Pimephales promelas TaxID=90988 RepID=UPI0019555DE0|nr:secretogranin-1 [Pimephales promelas]KAG1938456.1 secretogranin-1 [Pimephales promelas]